MDSEKNKALMDNPDKCPSCGCTEALQSVSFTCKGKEGIHIVKCNNCYEDWIEHFTMTHVTEPEYKVFK